MRLNSPSISLVASAAIASYAPVNNQNFAANNPVRRDFAVANPSPQMPPPQQPIPTQPIEKEARSEATEATKARRERPVQPSHSFQRQSIVPQNSLDANIPNSAAHDGFRSRNRGIEGSSSNESAHKGNVYGPTYRNPTADLTDRVRYALSLNVPHGLYQLDENRLRSATNQAIEDALKLDKAPGSIELPKQKADPLAVTIGTTDKDDLSMKTRDLTPEEQEALFPILMEKLQFGIHFIIKERVYNDETFVAFNEQALELILCELSRELELKEGIIFDFVSIGKLVEANIEAFSTDTHEKRIRKVINQSIAQVMKARSTKRSKERRGGKRWSAPAIQTVDEEETTTAESEQNAERDALWKDLIQAFEKGNQPQVDEPGEDFFIPESRATTNGAIAGN